MGFGRNKTEHSNDQKSQDHTLKPNTRSLQVFLRKEWEGGFQGYVNAVLQHTFAITLVDSSPSVPACGQNTLSKGIYDFHIQTLFFPTKANEAHGERHLDYDNLLTHMKKSGFFNSEQPEYTYEIFFLTQHPVFSLCVLTFFRLTSARYFVPESPFSGTFKQ